MIFQPPESVRGLFIAAGWFPDRRAFESTSKLNNHPASIILEALNGLVVKPEQGSGEECATSEFEFGLIEEFPSVQSWEALLSTHLVGVAEAPIGHGSLLVASDGRCFSMSLVSDAFCFVGNNFSEAAERGLLGRRARPMLRPDQASVSLYGICYKRGSQELYDYAILHKAVVLG